MKHEDIKFVLDRDEYIGKKITVCGWIKTIRKCKNMLFVEINDGTSLKNLQLVIDNSNFGNTELFHKLNVGASVYAEGVIVKSINNNQNVELNVENVNLFGDCPQDYPIQKKEAKYGIFKEYAPFKNKN